MVTPVCNLLVILSPKLVEFGYSIKSVTSILPCLGAYFFYKQQYACV
uniref:Uncharacterized protein n=1 Tax=Rhizophora mucronata TaxID=61149 RepID=A0A2P2Q205_RHIMU